LQIPCQTPEGVDIAGEDVMQQLVDPSMKLVRLGFRSRLSGRGTAVGLPHQLGLLAVDRDRLEPPADVSPDRMILMGVDEFRGRDIGKVEQQRGDLRQRACQGRIAVVLGS